jgi:ATP-dependent Lhr-like helicase
MASSISPVFKWFNGRFGSPTPAQERAWPRIARGENVLIASPTGTGKTLAAFLGVLDVLAREHASGALRDEMCCIYVSPLRALNYDLEKNLQAPLGEIYGGAAPIRVELRTGDTSAATRARQMTRPPHLLLTTPESLCLLLSQEKWTARLAGVRWVIVDEIHVLADNKRGAHLALSIERTEDLTGRKGGKGLQRIGVSATVAPMEAVAKFLSGVGRSCAVVDVSAEKRIELSVHTPLRKHPYPEAGFSGIRLVKELGGLIERHRTTLVFCNTRSGAEGTTYWLRSNFPHLAERIECHHASLEREVRFDVEDRLKRGELRAVVCSTSLELGIDIGSVDLVVMLSTPKGVSKALQRVGRAGHSIHRVSKGILMATNVSDLVECCATVCLARGRHLDEVRVPVNPLDVLAQHLVSMGCTERWERRRAFELVRRASPFETLCEGEFEDVLDYLAGGGASLRQQYSDTFGKIDLDATGFLTRPGRVRRDFLQNVGVIPNVAQVRVRAGSRTLGQVEEFFIRQLGLGDVFVLAGRPVRLDKVSAMEAWVTPADGAVPTVPRWNASKFPLSNRVCDEIVSFRRELRERLDSRDAAAWIAERLDCGGANARILLEMHRVQARVSEVPTDEVLLVEEHVETDAETRRPRARHYFFHSLIGRNANDALSRAAVVRLHEKAGGNAVATPHDYGFVLTVSPSQRLAEEALPGLFRPEGFDAALSEALRRSEMLKYHFRNAAQTGLMVYRNYFGTSKSVKKLAWSAEVIFNVLQQHEPGHVLMREAMRDTLHTFLDAEGAFAFVQKQVGRPVRLRKVEKVPPLAFPMYATKIKEAVMVEDPFEMQERLYHQWWMELTNEQHSI